MPHWSYLVTSPTSCMTLNRSLPALKFQEFALCPRNRQVSSTYSTINTSLRIPQALTSIVRSLLGSTPKLFWGKTDSSLGSSEACRIFYSACNVFFGSCFGNLQSGSYETHLTFTRNSASRKGFGERGPWNSPWNLSISLPIYMSSWVSMVNMRIQSFIYPALLKSGELLFQVSC